MDSLTVLISPLSWGFGHAGRMIPLAMELQKRGAKIIFAADAPLLEMAGREIPGITAVEIAGLRMRYSRLLPQYICIFLQLPHIIASAVRDHRTLRCLVSEYKPSVIISDNRFGFYNRSIFSVYVTHQLRIPFPRLLRFMEPLAMWMHRIIINRFDLCLVPDFPGSVNLSGRLSHGVRLTRNTIFCGPLSRFEIPGGTEPAIPDQGYPVCLLLSGPEPQSTLLLERIADTLSGFSMVILSATPLPLFMKETPPGIRVITTPDNPTMRKMLISSSLVIARSGYSSVMELVSLGKGAVIIPTPGQPEQEYLGRHLNGRFGFITMSQDNLEKLHEIAEERTPDHFPRRSGVNDALFAGKHDSTGTAKTIENLPAAAPLLEKTIDYLLEHKEK
ncbi:MAG: hypothetical protein GX622_06715 [Bacteroidales bacterium]|jgi:hypothetical protein|nr:hypothetical protein [Bacteroidales bacterium]